MTKTGYKHQTGEILERTNAMADYIKIDEKGVNELIDARKDPDKARGILVRYVLEDWVTHILDAYDAVVISVTEEVIKRNITIERQKLLRELRIKPRPPKPKVVKPVKNIDVKASDRAKGYTRTSPGRYENKKRTKLFISSRISMDNKKLTKEYNEWASQNNYKLRTLSAITTLKSRVKRGKWDGSKK